MKLSKNQKGLVLVLVTALAATFAVGCELIVDFDRTEIPVETPDASLPDATVPETGPGDDAGPADGGETPDDAGDGGGQ